MQPRKALPEAAFSAEETQINDPFDMRWATQPQIEEWARRAMKKHGAPRTRQIIEARMAQGKIDPDAYDLLLDYVARIEDMQRIPEVKPVPQVRRQKPQPKPDSQEDPTHQSMVLKLIAGVASAGIGGKRSSK